MAYLLFDISQPQKANQHVSNHSDKDITGTKSIHITKKHKHSMSRVIKFRPKRKFHNKLTARAFALPSWTVISRFDMFL